MNTILSKLMGTSFKRTKYSTTKFFSFLTLLLMLGVNGVMGQTAIARDSFETATSSPNFSFTISGGAYQTGASASTERPASTNKFLDGSRSYGVVNTNASLTSNDINTNGYTSLVLSLRLSSFSLNGSGNGADGGDSITIQISPDGGTNYYTRLSVLGNSNAYWGYAATGSSTNVYAANNSTLTRTLSGAGNQTSAGPSRISITGLPNTSNLRVRILLRNDNANELWAIDSLVLSGVAASDYYWNGNGGSSLSANFNTGPWSTSASTSAALTWPASGATNVAYFSNAQGGTVTMPTSYNSAPSNVVLGSAGYTFSTAASTPSTLSSTINLGANALTLSPNATSAALTLSGIISGTSGSLTNNTGTATLSATNTFTGGVTLTSGQLNINNAAALGTTAGTFAVNGGTIDNTSGGSITTSNYPQTWGGDFAFTGTNALNLGTGTVALGASVSRTVTANASTLTIGGIISGSSSSLTKAGNGTLALSGANTFNGGLNINAGTVSLAASNVLADAGSVTVNGGILNSAGAYTDSIGALTLTSGSITGSTGTLNPLSISVSSGTIDAIIGGGAAAMTKNTSGTVFLTNGSNTYAGGTTINGGILSVNGANRIGGTAVGVTINAGTFQLTTTSITSARAFNFNNSASTFDVASGIKYTNTTGTFTGSGILNKTGSGILTFQTSNSNAQTYNGLNIKGGTVSIGKETDLGSVPGSTNASYLLFDDGTLLDSNTITIDSKRGIVLGTGGGTINVLSTKTATYGGIIADNSGAGSLIKTGAGILTLTGTANSYTGSTTITAGELRLNPSANATFASQIVLNGGTLSTTSITGTRTFTSSSTLNLAASSTIALGGNAHTLTFANSSSVSWAGTTLTITGWTGTAGSTGTAGQIFVGAGGLTSAQLAKINFSGYSNGAMIVAGELLPFVSSSPTISTSGTLSAVSTTYGTATASPTSFTASGINLTADISISAPSGYEISQTVGGASGYATTQTLIQSSGTISSTTIYVRLAASSVVGSYTGNIQLTSTGADTVNVATVSSSVGTATLTITNLSPSNKTYDGTNAVVTGTAQFNNLKNGESFTPNSITWTFPDKNVGTAKVLTKSGTYSAPSSNYTVTQPTLTADISALTLTTSGSPSITTKQYDRTTTATVAGLSLTNVVSGDLVNIVGTYNDKTVNTGKAVTISLSGSDIANYTWSAPTGITGDITALALTISSPAAVSKSFDGTTAATITGSLSGVISGDAVTLSGTGTFASSAVGTGIAVTSTSTLGGADAGNYTLTQPTGLTADITVQAAGLLLLEDNFTHSAILTSNGYTNLSGAGTNNLTAGATGLTYSNYGSTAIGNALSVANNGQDVSRTFTQQNSSTTVYASFLVNVSAALTGDYIFALAPSAGGSNYRARTFIKASSNSGFINFGISNSGSVNYNSTPTNYATNTTHLVVVKYTFTSNTSATATVFINPSTSSEPSSGEVSFTDNTAANAPADINSFAIRQGSNTAAPTLVMDGIRIATNWGALMGNPQYNAASNIAAGNYNSINIFSNTVTAVGSVSITGNATIDGTLAIDTTTLTLAGSVSGSGSLKGASAAKLAISGSASNTIRFDQTTPGTTNLIKNLTISGAGTTTLANALNITGGSSFGVVTVGSGATLATGGNLTLKSTATGTAAIGNSAGNITGNITIERFMSQSGRRWRYISSPVTGQTLADWGTKFYITGPGTPGATIGSQNSNGYATSRSNLLGFNNAEGTPASVRIYNRTTTGTIENGWANPASNMATNLTPGVGYRAFIRGPITGNYATDTAVIGYFVPGAAPTQSSFTFTQTGGITTGVNAGSVSLPINSTGTDAAGAFNTSNDGWNLLGNPYPCAFDWLAFWSANTNRTNIANVIYIFDASANSYKSYNTSSGGSLTSGIIPSGSAFFVQATGTGASLTFTEAFKTSSAPIALHKKGATSDELQIKYYRDSTESDQYILKMINGATLQKDDYDIIKLKNDNLNLSSYAADSINLTLSSIPVVIEETKISLNVEATQRGTYKFDFNTINDFDNGISVSLLDKFTQKTIDIRKNPIYSFVMDSMPHQWGKDRFVLILNAKSTTTSFEDKQSSIINTKMVVYPNPASDVLNISINNSSFKNSSISIYNISGNEVLSSTMMGTSTQLNIESLSNGVYFVKVKNENGFDRTVKFIK